MNMKTLSRRNILTAAAPALAAAAILPTLAIAAKASARPLSVSPPLAALVAEFHQCKVEWSRLSDKMEVQAQAVDSDNPLYYRAHSRPANLGDSEWAAQCERYKAEYNARPEVVRLNETDEKIDRALDRKGDIADEISGLTAESFADLQAQLDIWFDYYCEWNIDGSISRVADMCGPELRFLVRLPGELARLAGAS